jgi:hypothetical protein
MRIRVDFEDTGRLRSNLHRLDEETKHGLALAFDVQAARSTAYMKTNAPWSDRTTAARNGLHAVATHHPGRYELVLSHAVYYGIFLEVCNNGKYQIILPSLRQAVRELQGLIDHMWRDL